jgi:uncharacterized protein DUF4388
MLRGTLREFSLFEIFRLISDARKTGVLEISGPSVTGQILFRDGCVYGSRSAGAREPLGRKLVRAGTVTEDQLRTALAFQVNSTRRLGRILIDSGVDPLRVDEALEEQAEEGAVSILRLDPTEFEWTSGPAETEPLSAVPADDFLARVVTKLEEVEVISSRLTIGDKMVSLSPSASADGSGIQLDPEEWRIIALLGTRRSVVDLIQYSGDGEVQTLLTLDHLLALGLLELHPVDDVHAVRARSVAPELPPRGHSASPGPKLPEEQVIHLTEHHRVPSDLPVEPESLNGVPRGREQPRDEEPPI